jgi:hypothetical protein
MPGRSPRHPLFHADTGHTSLHTLRRSCSARRLARARGGQPRTSSRWSGWRRNAALSYAMPRPVAGTMAAEAIDPTAGTNGQATHGGQESRGRRPRRRRKQREPGRGHLSSVLPLRSPTHYDKWSAKR